MEFTPIAIAVFTLAFALVAKRLSTSIITPALAFLAFGWLLGETGALHFVDAEELLHIVAEVTLVIVLFSDAAQIDLDALRRRHQWPVRMLVPGMPLAILVGAPIFYFLLPSPSVAMALLLAAILAPTDAALGQAVVTNPAVPMRVRRALTVESGLNDGIALPAVLFFASLAGSGVESTERNWVTFTAAQVLLGPLVGIAVAWLGGKMILLAAQRGFTDRSFEGITVLALAALAYLAAEAVGGNGFLSVFLAGLTFGHVVGKRCAFVFEFTETEGQALILVTFLLVGAVLLPETMERLDLRIALIALVSLFVVRPVAIWLSLIGTKCSGITRLFFGWFGPRGLATVLFALLVARRIDPEGGELVLTISVVAVSLSALLHGVTAAPGGRWYARKVQLKGKCPETVPVEESAKELKTAV